MMTISDQRKLYALRFGGILTIAGIVILADRISKWWVLNNFMLGESRMVTSFLSFTRVENTGTAFGMFPGNNKALLILGVVILASLLYGARGLSERGGLWGALGVALVLGGAIGNMVDRIHFGRVIDFLDFHFWPVFNLADSSITLGTVCILIGMIRRDNF